MRLKKLYGKNITKFLSLTIREPLIIIHAWDEETIGKRHYQAMESISSDIHDKVLSTKAQISVLKNSYLSSREQTEKERI